MIAERPAPTWDVPPGFHHKAIEHDDWRLVSGKRCRRVAQRREVCGKPAVAELNRGRYRSVVNSDLRRVDYWWAYCPEHLYGNWIENGKVMHWILEADE